MRVFRLTVPFLCVAALLSGGLLAQAGKAPIASGKPDSVDKNAEKWVQTTLSRMTVDQKAGQMLVSSFPSTYEA